MSEEISKFRKKSPYEHFVNSIKAILAGIPLPGAGTVATLIDDYIPRSSEIALERFLHELDERVKKLEDRINVVTMDKDDFAELFKSCYVGVIKTTQQEKVKIFAALFVNMMLKEDDPDKALYSELDHFARAMDSLSIGALHVMIRIYELCPDVKQCRTNFSNIYQSFSAMVPALVMSLIQELNSLHLVEVTAPTVRVNHYDNYSIELTFLGRNFVQRYAK